MTSTKVVESSAGGETVRAYVPPPLPPDPPIELLPLLDRLGAAERALARLDGITVLLPSHELFLYMYVRKEVVVVAVEGASGTGELTYTKGTLTDSGSVIVAAAVAASVVLDSDDAVITAQASTASTAPATAPALTPAAPLTTLLPQ